MPHNIGSYLFVALWCGLKFVPGVGFAIAAQFDFLEQFIVTSIGGIIGVTIFTFAGDYIRLGVRHLIRRRQRHEVEAATTKTPSRSQRFARRIWDKYGLVGVAFLTPPLFSPPIGTAIAIAFGAQKKKIVLYMSLSMLLWATVFALLGIFVGDAVLGLLKSVGLA